MHDGNLYPSIPDFLGMSEPMGKNLFSEMYIDNVAGEYIYLNYILLTTGIWLTGIII